MKTYFKPSLDEFQTKTSYTTSLKMMRNKKYTINKFKTGYGWYMQKDNARVHLVNSNDKLINLIDKDIDINREFKCILICNAYDILNEICIKYADDMFLLTDSLYLTDDERKNTRDSITKNIFEMMLEGRKEEAEKTIYDLCNNFSYNGKVVIHNKEKGSSDVLYSFEKNKFFNEDGEYNYNPIHAIMHIQDQSLRGNRLSINFNELENAMKDYYLNN